MRFFHYTKAINLPGIYHDGALKRSPPYFKDDRAFVWLTTNDYWDNGAGKLTNSEQGLIVSCAPGMLLKYGYRALIPIRIEVDPAAVKVILWREYRESPSYVVTRKAQGAKHDGADIGEWAVCCEDIPLESCVYPIEKLVDGRWEGLSRSALMRRLELWPIETAMTMPHGKTGPKRRS